MLASSTSPPSASSSLLRRSTPRKCDGCTTWEYSVSANNNLNASGSRQVADCISEPRYVKQGNNALWIEPGALDQPPEPRFGNIGSNNFRGPGLVNLDLGIFRKFQETEKFELQFRAEGFNMANTPHFERPNGRSITSGNFMILNRIRNTGREGIDERFVRIGLRLGWQAARSRHEGRTVAQPFFLGERSARHRP